MKALFKDGTELQVNSYKDITENRIQISFAGITSYDELRAKLTVTATKTIKVYEDETSFVAYENFTKVVDPCTITTAADGTLDVVVLLEREDELSQRVRVNEENITALYAAVDFLLGV